MITLRSFMIMSDQAARSITSPLLLFTIAFIFGGFYLISRQNGQPLTLGNTVISPSTMYAAYGGASFILLLFSGATGAIFWIIGK